MSACLHTQLMPSGSGGRCWNKAEIKSPKGFRRRRWRRKVQPAEKKKIKMREKKKKKRRGGGGNWVELQVKNTGRHEIFFLCARFSAEKWSMDMAVMI